jgi:hypothetical protein
MLDAVNYLRMKCQPYGRVAQLGEHLLCKRAGKITQVPHLVSLTRTHAVQPTS